MKTTSKISLLVLSLALSASALLAETQTGNVVNVTDADAGKTIILHQNQTLCVTLAPGVQNPTIGAIPPATVPYLMPCSVQQTWNTALLYQNKIPSGVNQNIYSFAPTDAMEGQTELTFLYDATVGSAGVGNPTYKTVTFTIKYTRECMGGE